jgi:DNA mismatch endonuclease Vsr
MRAIKGRDTSIELLLRKELFKRGLRFRINYKKLPGSPDVVFVKTKVAIFCDSEFWHGKDWERKKNRIICNREYWIRKIENNIKRDLDNNRSLSEMGWRVLRFWGKDIQKNMNIVVESIVNEINR